MTKTDLKLPSGHIRALDGLRGLAILLVLFYHVFPGLVVTKIGWSGVDLFFVLSGFLITGILIDTRNHPHYWKNFFVRRVLRIFPLYYFFIFLVIFIAHFSKWFYYHDAVNFDSFSELSSWLFLYIVNWKISIDASWLNVSIFNIFWSLSVEEQFYLIWPFVVLLTKNKLFPFTIITILLIILTKTIFYKINLTNHYALYTFTFYRIETILWGSLMAIALRDEKLLRLMENWLKPIFLVSFLLIVLMGVLTRSVHPFKTLIQLYGYTLIAIFFASSLVMIIAVSKDNKNVINSIFESRIMVFFGKYSYGIYIYHGAIFLLFFQPIFTWFKSYSIPSFLASILSGLAVSTLTIIISLISWNLLESRMISLKKYYSY